MADAECVANFRFAKDDILPLSRALQIPDYVTCKNGTKVQDVESLCISLRRLTNPDRLSDLVHMFGRSVCELSRICNTVLSAIYDTHGHLLVDFSKLEP